VNRQKARAALVITVAAIVSSVLLALACGGEVNGSSDTGTDATLSEDSPNKPDAPPDDVYKCFRPDVTCTFCNGLKGCRDGAPDDATVGATMVCDAGEQCLRQGLIWSCCDPCVRMCP
jgi:hypothetical protein